MSATTLVLGIGNTLLSDEGVGVRVIEHLSRHHSDVKDAQFLDGGTLSFTLAEPIAENDNLIVVDAARFDAAPGSLRCFEGPDMDRYLTGNRHSVHEVGLTDLLDIARLSSTYPAHRALIGIQPDSLEWGETLSPVVAAAVTNAADQVLGLMQRWRDRS